MPRFDDCHHQVVRALQKEGWIVRRQHTELSIEERTVYIDILASKSANGRSESVLLAEVKCFPESESSTTQLYIAIGQYIVYRAMLEALNFEMPLYLAVPEMIYTTLFDPIIMKIMRDYAIKMMIVDLVKEKIVKWSE